jgi:glucosylceramidase
MLSMLHLIRICAVFAAIPMTLSAQLIVDWWSSTESLELKLAPQPALRFAPGTVSGGSSVRVETSKVYQEILGLGSSLEHSTCYNLMLLPPERRERVIESLAHPTRGIGMSLMRICIGTPDFTASPWYTYDDMPPGAKDPELKQFSIAKDREYVLPVLKAAQRANPELKFFASPWSPPAWMKTSDRIGGGRINPEHFRPFAEYLARFVEAYRGEGIEVHALTIQNEPGYAPDTYPTCRWTATEQRDFIRDHLGPVFQQRKLSTRIWCFDHNFNNPDFPATILKDSRAAQYVDGTAFHHYEGKPSAMLKLQGRFPAKHLYFTEGSTFGVEGAGQIISFLASGARSYNAWVTMIDHRLKPNPGPHECSPTCIVLNRDRLEPEYRFDYFMYGQFMRFIRPGAARLGAAETGNAPPHIAFRNADGSFVLVTTNPEPRSRELRVVWEEKTFAATLPAKSVSTFQWRP